MVDPLVTRRIIYIRLGENERAAKDIIKAVSLGDDTGVMESHLADKVVRGLL